MYAKPLEEVFRAAVGNMPLRVVEVSTPFRAAEERMPLRAAETIAPHPEESAPRSEADEASRTARGSPEPGSARGSPEDEGARSRAGPAEGPAGESSAAGGKARAARGSPAPAEPSVLHELLSLFAKVAAVALVCVLVTTFLYGLHRNTDADMVPAVKDGDLVVFYRIDKDYAAGDLLLLRFQGRTQVRRVVATEGDAVDVTERGLTINGALQQELYISEKTRRDAEGADLPVTLGEREVFVLGDSRENATDSRVYGAVNTKDTLGTVIAVVRRRNL
jgi:signal peptidase I